MNSKPRLRCEGFPAHGVVLIHSDTSEYEATLIDTLFFADGRFLGPNRSGLWEFVVGAADAAIFVGRVAAHGATVGEVLEAAGPAPEPMGSRQTGREFIAWVVRSMCRNPEDVGLIAGWADTVTPLYTRVDR